MIKKHCYLNKIWKSYMNYKVIYQMDAVQQQETVARSGNNFPIGKHRILRKICFPMWKLFPDRETWISASYVAFLLSVHWGKVIVARSGNNFPIGKFWRKINLRILWVDRGYFWRHIQKERKKYIRLPLDFYFFHELRFLQGFLWF